MIGFFLCIRGGSGSVVEMNLSRQVKIVSDGTCGGTKVLNYDGTEIPHVVAVKFASDADLKLTVAWLKIRDVAVDIKVDEVLE
jgi:hypothetical protein